MLQQKILSKFFNLKSLTKQSELDFIKYGVFDMKLLITILTMIFISLGASAETIWKNYSKNDEMTGEESVYIYTKSVKSTRPMSFPYNKTSSFIALMCTKKNKSIDFSFLFSIAPNINNKEIIIKNFDKIKTRIKFGDKITNVELLQKWGSKQITLRNHKLYLDDLKSSDELLLELDWHGDGKRYFKHSIKGFSQAYEDLKSKCGLK